MTTVYVNKRSELTAYKDNFERFGLKAYRTRTTCLCAEGQNRRNAILLINSANYVSGKVIQCKACVKLQEGGTNE